MKTIRTILLVLLFEIVVAAAVAVSGICNVDAIREESGPIDWMLSVVSDRSIDVHAARLAELDLSRASLASGAARYQELCIGCHGGPGVAPGPIGKGLNPRPPDLVVAALGLTDRETYWTIKNGIKMTGMPAFGPSLGEEDLLALTALVRKIPATSPDDFQNLLGSGLPANAKPGGEPGATRAPRKESEKARERTAPPGQDPPGPPGAGTAAPSGPPGGSN